LPLSPNLTAALFMCLSMAGFTANDVIAKHLSASMNMGQVMLLRGLFATLFIAALAWHRGALRTPLLVFQPLVMLRVAGEALATITFLIALAQLPVANVAAVLQALPLAVTMGAALFFGEGVGWRRWLAIIAGFIGVAIIVRPGFEGFSAYSLLAFLTVCFAAMRDLVTKRIPHEVPTLLISTATAGTVTLCGLFLVGPMGGWVAPTGPDFMQLAIAAALLLVGYQFIIMAMRIGEISFVAPFRYTGLLWAIVLGLLVFNEVPDLPMLLGAAIIVASGLYTLYRERVVGRSMASTESIGPTMAPDGL
jgi:drug/metabolite transporter (DMT)-like permease